MKITLSEIDKERFGVVIAKASIGPDDSIQSVISWCESANVEMLIVRTPTDDIGLVQTMEQAGFYLTDTLVYYRNKAIATKPVTIPDGYTWRLAGPQDAAAIENLAAKTFNGYAGHYHADPRINRADADLVYSSWAMNSCRDKTVADAVLLIEHGQEIAGFATVKSVESYMFEGVLFGVNPAYQGKNLYSSLMQLAQHWGHELDFGQMLVSTQITNLAVQKVWCRQGFEPFKSFYTFHRWFS
jgi:GNAT superfamily N-acetyltransferase